MLGRGTNVKDEEPDPKPETAEAPAENRVRCPACKRMITLKPLSQDPACYICECGNQMLWYISVNRHDGDKMALVDRAELARLVDRAELARGETDDILHDRLARLDKGLEELAKCARRGESQIGPILDMLAAFIDEIRNLVCECGNQMLMGDVLRDRLDRLDKGLEELAECARRGESQIRPILDMLAAVIDEIRVLVGGRP